VSVNSVIVLSNKTLEGDDVPGPVTYLFSVSGGDTVSIDYVPGVNYNGENTYEVFDTNTNTSIVKKSGDGTADLEGTGPEDYTFTVNADGGGTTEGGTSTYSIILSDSAEDGFDGGAYIDVIVNSVTVLSNLTSTDSGPATFTFEVSSGDIVKIDYVPGSQYNGENAYEVKNGSGTTIAQYEGAGIDPDDAGPADYTFTVP
jgi:hypothetical protein